MKFSPDVLNLNPNLRDPEIRSLVQGNDMADVLLAHIRREHPEWDDLVRDHPFQRYKIDIAISAEKLAIEVDGGQYKPGGGKHGTERDYDKINDLQLDGWMVLRFRAIEVENNPDKCLEYIRKARSIYARLTSNRKGD